MTIAISGINGNLGSHLAAIAPGPVIGISRHDWKGLDDRFADAGQIDTIIHAAHDFNAKCADSPTAYVNSNLSTTARLLEATRNHGVGSFCYISSSAIYHTSAEPGFSSHDSGTRRNPYAHAKRMNEVMIEEFCERHAIRWVSCRIFNIFGGNDKHSIVAALDRAIESRRPFVMNNHGEDTRDYIHVSDAAKIVLRLALDGRHHHYFDVGTGKDQKISDVVGMYRELHPELEIKLGPDGFATRSRADGFVSRSVLGTPFVSLPAFLSQSAQIRSQSTAQATRGFQLDRGA